MSEIKFSMVSNPWSATLGMGATVCTQRDSHWLMEHSPSVYT